MSDLILPGKDPYADAGIDWAMLRRVLCRESLIAYIKAVAPWFVVEEIHCILAAHLEAVAAGDIDRFMTFMFPRSGKSTTASIFFPSWYAGKLPSDKIMQVGYKVELSRGFSLDVRELMRLPEYQWIFPGVQLAKDAKAAGKWRVEEITSEAHKLSKQRTQQGQYNAAGTTSGIAGTGFNLGVVDDPSSEQDKDSKLAKDRVWNWWGPGFYTRRQPERNAIVLMTTRWAKDDLAGHLLEQKHHGADVWTVLNIPAILDKDSAKRVYTVAKEYGQIEDLKDLKAGDSAAPRRWSLKELERSRAQLTQRDWQALYMGNPSEEEGHILKKKYWRLWPKAQPPECVFIFQMYDTAMEAKESNDYSARTTWGVFEHKEHEGERPTFNMILLDRWQERLETPELKRQIVIAHFGGKKAKEILSRWYPNDKEEIAKIDDHAQGFQSDRILIENKGGAIGLIQELRKLRDPTIPVWPWKLPRGLSGELGKFARAKLASLVFEQGAVWYMDRTWASEVIDACASCHFDGSDSHDDLQDTVTSAAIYVRHTYRVELKTDIDEEEEALANQPRQTRKFYGARG